MRITKHTDYALRVLIYLGSRKGGRVTTQSIADAFNISGSHLQKVVRALGELGVIELFRGVNGGVELTVDPADIFVGEVVRALDDEDAWIECFSEDTDDCVVSTACGLKSALRTAQEAFYASLDPVSVADVIGRRGSALKRLTGG
jgi:Rrf2 family nitric oxide-sensitive transcriptional repressor